MILNKTIKSEGMIRKGRILSSFKLILLISAFLPGSMIAQSIQPTPRMSEGPYWKSGSPQRTVLYQQHDRGRKIEVSGKVLDISGGAISGTKIDIWQTDGNGAYDNTGFRFRGHVFANDSGKYRFKTVLPGEYPGRTPHIHIKLTAPDGKRLTTQLYFPEHDSRNQRDWLYDENLVVKWASKTLARFDFILKN